jgi:hypothetical protein
MAKVAPYHTSSEEDDPVHHVYDNCPAGERVIRDGNSLPGTGGHRLCDFCDRKNRTGEF